MHIIFKKPTYISEKYINTYIIISELQIIVYQIYKYLFLYPIINGCIFSYIHVRIRNYLMQVQFIFFYFEYTDDIGYITDINANISNDINIIRQENNIKISFSKKKKISFSKKNNFIY